MQDRIALVLTADPSSIARIEAVAAQRSREHRVEARPFQGPVAVAVAGVRAELGGIPVGVLARDDTEALQAIEAGADEADTLGASTDADVHRFLDRLRVRANQRRARERRRDSEAHAEKLVALGTLVAGVGHEINNPLTALRLSIDVIRRVVPPLVDVAAKLESLAGGDASAQQLESLVRALPRARQRAGAASLLEEMEVNSDAIATLVRDLCVFARADEGERPVALRLSEVVDQVIRMAGREVTRHAVIERDYEPGETLLLLPPGRVKQVLMNLLVNAGHAMREVERPAHRLRITVRRDEDFVALSVSDTGPGIAPEALERVFDPFFTTKRVELGTGLGLSISRSLMRGLGGDLLVESVFGEGATFICLFPRPTEGSLRSARPAASERAPDPAPREGVSVLLVDEDTRVQRAVARVLDPHVRLVIASDGEEAVELLSSDTPADVIFFQLDIPGLDAVRFHEWLQREHPELLARLVLTGDPGHPRYASWLERSGLPVLAKPVDSRSLLSAIARAAGGGSTAPGAADAGSTPA